MASGSDFVTGEVIDRRDWTERMISLRIRTAMSPFKAGQFIRLRLPVNGTPVARSYSLVNGPDEPDLEVLFDRVPEGQLSLALAALKPGDRVEVSQPAAGYFVLDEVPDSRQLWMFATGTGVGPYLSILKTGAAWKRFDKLVLVHGVRSRDELVYGDLVRSWQEMNPERFSFISCVSREKNSAGLEGRLTDCLADGRLESALGLSLGPADAHVMLCGNRLMIEDMKTLLGERGMARHLRRKPGHITTEHYF